MKMICKHCGISAIEAICIFNDKDKSNIHNKDNIDYICIDCMAIHDPIWYGKYVEREEFTENITKINTYEDYKKTTYFDKKKMKSTGFKEFQTQEIKKEQLIEEEHKKPIVEQSKLGGIKMVEQTNEVIGMVERKTFNVNNYIGKRVKIASIEEKLDAKYKDNLSPFIKVFTEPIDKLDNGTPVVASKILGLYCKDGKIFWYKDSKMGLFLKEMGVENYKDLIGKEVIIQTTPANAEGKKFLTF